jgi:hypothetical protein
MAVSDVGVLAFAAMEGRGLSEHPVVVLYDLMRDAELARLHFGDASDQNPEEYALEESQKVLLASISAAD